jgi:hypothetical protein
MLHPHDPLLLGWYGFLPTTSCGQLNHDNCLHINHKKRKFLDYAQSALRADSSTFTP